MARGGKRSGAGRPHGTGLFGEETKPVRIPVSRIEDVRNFLLQGEEEGAEVGSVPLYSNTVQAGLPAEANDEIESHLNLHSYLVDKPEDTFFVRAKGRSMINAGIQDGDLMVVNRRIQPKNGHIVIAMLEGELTVKRWHKQGNQLALLPENDDYPPIIVGAEQECQVWGVVTSVVHQF